MASKPKPRSRAKPVKPVAAPAQTAALLADKPVVRHKLRLPATNRRIGSEHVFWAAVCISVLLHMALLATHFKPFEARRNGQLDRGLEVVLVNARHAHAPKKPQALAQANLDGGGNTSDDKAMPVTPLPSQEQTQAGDALIQTLKRAEQLEALQRELLAQNHKRTSVQLEHPAPLESAKPSAVRGDEDEERHRAIARLEAVIDKDQRDYAARPRKKFVAARTAEFAPAQYFEDWRQKVERVGTINFPQSGGKRLYGSVGLYVEIRADGSVAVAEVKRSSGNRTLDNAALRILQLAGPFAPFPSNIRKEADILQIYRTWDFSRADVLDASRDAPR
jgi:protein TonB